MNIAEIVAKVKNANTVTKKVEKGAFSLIDYSPEDNNKDLAHIDKFLKVISNNERLTITYHDDTSAYMNMDTMEIRLPNYITKDRDIYLMMGSHEVSHCLHTPRDFYKQHDKNKSDKIAGIKINRKFHSCINIVEDIRIEKLIRNKFPGFVATYQRAYEKLIKTNPHFQLTQKDWDNSDIANKVNIKAKLGNLCPFELTTYEFSILKYMKSAVTFDDVILRAVYLYKELIKDELDVDKEEAPDSDEKPDEDLPETDIECDAEGNNTNTDENKKEGNTKGSDKDSDKNDKESDDSDSSDGDSSDGDSSDSDKTDKESDASDSDSSDGDSEESSSSSDDTDSSSSQSNDPIQNAMDAIEKTLKDLNDIKLEETPEGFDKEVLKTLNQLVSQLDECSSDENDDNDIKDIMEDSKNRYQKDIENKFGKGGGSVFSTKQMKEYKEIVKNPKSSLISMY